jgi:hypothetical protein
VGDGRRGDRRREETRVLLDGSAPLPGCVFPVSTRLPLYSSLRTYTVDALSGLELN